MMDYMSKTLSGKVLVLAAAVHVTIPLKEL